MLLIHQLPPKPAYFRVKIWRRLQGLGAIALKNSVYVLPAGDQTREDFEWLWREIVEGGAEATLCEARFIEGLGDAAIRALFNAARDADYDEIARELRALGDHEKAELASALRRLERRFRDVARVDFFDATGRVVVEGLLGALKARIEPAAPDTEQEAAMTKAGALTGKVWVTRRGVEVDRIASAWLVRRCVDPAARFKFVATKDYVRQADEVRFDMFEAEITHIGEQCTFEVLMARVGLADPALQSIAEIVHDLDLKDGKFAREEATGIGRLLAGIYAQTSDDDERLHRGGALFEDLYRSFGGLAARS
ncbi:MAG: ChrB protein [Alphaproteobacteria bacterium]|nr:ChrB protein [Alphaproteobacteria bacterium]